MRKTDSPECTFIPAPYVELGVAIQGDKSLPHTVDKRAFRGILLLSDSYVTENLTVPELRELGLEGDLPLQLMMLGFLKQTSPDGVTYVEVPLWLQKWYNELDHRVSQGEDWPDHKTGLQQESFEGVGCEAL